MDSVRRLSDAIVEHSRIVIVVLLLASVVIGAGAGMVERSSSLDQFSSDTPEAEAQEYLTENFTVQENTTTVQVIVRGENVLTKESLLRQLRYEQSLLANETVRDSLAEESPVFGISNLVATAAIRQEQGANASAQPPALADQIAQVESMNETEVARTVQAVLGEQGSDRAYSLMPTGFDPGSGEANATMIVVTQQTDGAAIQGTASDRIIDSQLAIRAVGDEAFGAGDALVFGSGIIADEVNRSMTDSLAIVGPLALVFVLIVLIIAYRDFLDIVLGLVGIFLVLLWTFGFMGWLDIAFNQIMIAVPVLLIGLSIDYAIHIFMRHREEREDNGGARPSMKVALSGVGVALLWVTATTVIGFLSNLTSPVPPIREFGVVSAFGIVAALIIFGGLMPAVKASLDSWLETRGIDREKRAFGTGGGRFSQALSVGSTAARKAPWVVVALTLLVSAGGVYGATQVNTTFNQEDFIADEPAEWMKDLPEPFAPGSYQVKSTLDYVNDNFVREDAQASILIRGDVTDPATLQRVDEAADAAAGQEVTVTLSNGEAAISGPLTSMRQVAAQNESFNQTFAAADTDGDGVPDRGIEEVYDEFYRVAPQQAAQVVSRSDDGEYDALRLSVSVVGGASGQEVTTAMRDLAAIVEGDGVDAIATGTPIVNKIVQDQLLDTVVQSLIITLVVSFLFLMLVYRITDGSATLGLVTLLPVAFNVTWILGTMYLADIPFNVLTGMITSLTVGLGVAYSIHVSERFSLELDRTDSVWTAMDDTVTGTGGALLGSAATTVGGFGVLAFAILPPLQQFGIITGMTIIYAFLASVLILPSLLALWAKYIGPGLDGHGADDDTGGDDHGPGGEPVATADDEADAGGDASGGEAAIPNRTITPRHVEPGGHYRDVVTVENASGRTVVRETAPGETVTVEAIEPEPMERAQVDGTVYALWSLEEPTDLRLELAADLAADSIDGEEPAFDGTLHTAEGAVGIGGDTTVAVVSDPFDRLLAKGEVTDADLELATEQLAAGQLTRRQFERIYATWVDAESAETVSPFEDRRE